MEKPIQTELPDFEKIKAKIILILGHNLETTPAEPGDEAGVLNDSDFANTEVELIGYLSSIEVDLADTLRDMVQELKDEYEKGWDEVSDGSLQPDAYFDRNHLERVQEKIIDLAKGLYIKWDRLNDIDLGSILKSLLNEAVISDAGAMTQEQIQESIKNFYIGRGFKGDISISVSEPKANGEIMVGVTAQSPTTGELIIFEQGMKFPGIISRS